MTTMTKNDFDYNISHYTITDLEEIFELPKIYNLNTIHEKEGQLNNIILNNVTISSVTKTKTTTFLNEAKKKLIHYHEHDDLKNKNHENNEFLLTLPEEKSSSLANTYKNIYNLNDSLNSSKLEIVDDHYNIKQPLTAYGNSYPSEFYQGTINPLKKRILRKYINIDTRFRENYYGSESTNFLVNLPIQFTNVVSLQLSALELIGSFYAINKVNGNNYFSIYIPDQNLDPLIIKIPDGNYDYLSLQNYLNTIMTNQTNLYQYISFTSDINTPNGTSNGGSGRMVVGIIKNAPSLFNFQLNFQADINGHFDANTPLPLKFGWIAGFRNGVYENNSTYVSEGVIDLSGPKYLYLVIDDFNNSVNDGFYGAFSSSLLNKNILARITLEPGIFNYFSENNFSLVTTPRQYFGPVTINKFQVQLLDEYGRILNLNNMDYSFCLNLQTIYDL